MAFIRGEKDLKHVKGMATQCRNVAFFREKKVNSGSFSQTPSLPSCLSGFCGNSEHTGKLLGTEPTAFATPDMGRTAYNMDFASR